jgi:hypothetical protein
VCPKTNHTLLVVPYCHFGIVARIGTYIFIGKVTLLHTGLQLVVFLRGRCMLIKHYTIVTIRHVRYLRDNFLCVVGITPNGICVTIIQHSNGK